MHRILGPLVAILGFEFRVYIGLRVSSLSWRLGFRVCSC